MKLKRTNKLLALLLAVVMVMSLLPVGAMAVDDFHLIIDLTGYFGKINGAETASIELNVMGDINTVTIKPNTKNDIVLPQNSTLNGTIILNLDDFTYDNEDISKSWKIDGITESTEKNTFSLVEQTAKIEIKFKNTLGMSSTAITIQESQISFKSNWSIWSVFNQAKNLPNKTIIITPIFASGSGVTATAVSSSAEQGSAAAFTASGENEWIINATPNDGYSFHYWLRDNDADTAENRITDNPYTVTLDADATFTAYFRERYTLTAESEDTAKGTAVAQYTGASNGVDNYTLTATPADYYAFDKWTCGNDEYIDNPLDVSVSESGKTYTAHFSPLALSLEDGAAWKLVGSAANAGIANTFVGSQAGIPSVGSRCALFLPVSIPGAMGHVSIALSVADGQGQTLGECTIEDVTFDYAFSGYIDVRFDPAPAVSSVTATLSLTTPAGSSTVTKTYTGLSVAESETNDAFHFVTSPSDGYTYKTIQSAGANLNGVYARTEDATKALSLYGYGPKGVIVWNAGGVSASRLGSMTLGDGEEVKALGPDGETGLTAAVGSTTSIRLYTWNGESWAAVEGSARAADASQKGTKIALVMDGDDVWTDTKHWTGSGWEDHAYDFASFQRVSDTEAYGVDGGGNRWRYDGTTWSAAAAAPAAPDTSSVASRTLGAGQDQNGDWYCFVQARFHFIDDSGFYGYSGSDVYKWNGEKWVYQIMTDFNDPDDDLTETKQRIRPDGVRTISSPAPGVSVMYGSSGADGAIYLSADDVTITFDPSEGTLDDDALAKLTAPILSEIDSAKIPGATRDGFAFSGWFYDEACTAEFKSGDAVMPGENVTLYAKWDENADPLAYHRQKALDELDKQFGKYSEADYTAENWQALVSACEDGRKAINEATAGTPNIEDNITAALNAALAKMQAIEPKNTDEITVAVSVDADVLGLGYLLKPTLVTVDKNSAASILTESVLNERAKEQYGMTGTGLYGTNSAESSSTLYPWVVNTSQGWYLAEVYFPEQQNYKLPDAIQEYVDGNHVTFNDDDKTGKYLGEFDYTVDSGWLYSVGDKTEGNAAFPGLGASGWGLSDGEVVRWQYTVVGRGIDVGNDYNGEPIINAAEKSALTWEVATLRSKYSDATLEANEKYADALKVLTDAEATQAEVDAALAALRGETFTEPVTGVSLDQTELSVTVGKTAELTATVEPDNATDKTVTWSSSDETVATVADGVVTGVKAGTATITVTTTDGGKTATCAVTVVEEAIPVSGVTLDKESAELTVGDTLTLTTTVAPSGAADKSVTWSSSDESVATVADGVVTAVKAGTATITVTTTDGGKTASCAVTVKAAPVAVTGVTLDKTTAEVKAGETVTLTATVAPADATDKTVTWSSSNVTVATVENGVVTGVKAGRVTITAAASGKTATCAVTVTAAEEQPTELTYPEALKAVQDYLKKEAPNPGVGATGGEWAVFALNRGGVAEEDWNNKYLAALQTYVAENDGVLHEKKYTEYSRVVIALTSMGVDATQFKAGEKTYDLVSPLLDKQNNGKTWAEWQGNNGTAFALLALDSHNYLDNEEGNATRAALIKSLKDNQQASGGWPISGESVDLDVTAAAVYALAPYLNAERASAVGVSVSDVQAMIDAALAFLSSRQNENGGFGSAEADGWIIIALSTLGRDADTDKQFVKNGKSVLDDLLSYFDETTGGFRHLADGSVDQMASEQAAYDLAAYDRFKKGQNTLYDMTDVTFPDPEAPTVDVTGVTLDKTEAGVEEGKTVTLTATIQPENATDKVVIWTSSDETVATVVNGTVTGVKAGSATITATAGGKSATCAVTVTAATGTTPGGQDKKTISVTMRLIGAEKASKDVDLGATPAYLPDYVTWIPTTSYELDEGATVYDLWVKATGEAGIRSVGADKNYVETVYAPEEGYALSEFTNGKRSGWMYTINGSHPGYGLVEQTLHNGDTVIWHYINDYSYECADWFGGDDKYPSLGDGTYYNLWLKAPDTYLGKGGGIPLSGSGDPTNPDAPTGTETPGETEEPTTGEPTVTETVEEREDGSTVTTVTETSTESKENEDGTVTDTTIEKVTETVTDAEGKVTETATETVTETTTGTTENEDGSVTETVTTAETVTEKVTDADGNVTETSTETVTSTETTTGTVENEDGTVTDTTTEKVTETVTDADGNVTETVTEITTATTGVENEDGSVTETVATETAEKVTETVTDADGNVSMTVTEKAESKTLETTTDAEGKVSGSGTVSSTTTVTDENGQVLSTAVTEGEITIDTDEKGTVSEVTTATTTTTDADGSETTETTVTTDAVTADGSTGTTVEDGEGKTLSAVIIVSEQALENANETGEPINAPVWINPEEDAEKAAPITVIMPEQAESAESVAEMAQLEIGLRRDGPGIVAYASRDGETPELVKECRRGSLIVPVDGDCEIVIVDNTKQFDDVDVAKWYGDSVIFVTAREIFNGNGDGTFNPGGNMNRAMVAQILFNLYRESVNGDGGVFSDVEAGKWYFAEVGWAAACGLITGYTDGTYKPTKDVTRQELVTILWRYMKMAGYAVEGVGDDVDLAAYSDGGDVNSYAADAMRWAIALGLVKGYEDNTLRPTATATRAEVAAIMQRTIEYAMK